MGEQFALSQEGKQVEYMKCEHDKSKSSTFYYNLLTVLIATILSVLISVALIQSEKSSTRFVVDDEVAHLNQKLKNVSLYHLQVHQDFKDKQSEDWMDHKSSINDILARLEVTILKVVEKIEENHKVYNELFASKDYVDTMDISNNARLQTIQDQMRQDNLELKGGIEEIHVDLTSNITLSEAKITEKINKVKNLLGEHKEQLQTKVDELEARIKKDHEQKLSTLKDNLNEDLKNEMKQLLNSQIIRSLQENATNSSTLPDYVLTMLQDVQDEIVKPFPKLKGQVFEMGESILRLEESLSSLENVAYTLQQECMTEMNSSSLEMDQMKEVLKKFQERENEIKNLRNKLFKPAGSSLVYFTDKLMTFSAGQRLCADIGAHLPEVYTFSEANELLEAEKAENFRTELIWLGAYRMSGSEFEWIYSDRPVSFSLWNAREPNNSGDSEDCIEMLFPDGHWNDIRCGEEKRVVCQYRNETVSRKNYFGYWTNLGTDN